VSAALTFRYDDRESQDGAAHAALVTPDDGTDLPFVTRAISFAAAGAIKVTTLGGEILVIPDGAIAPRVMHPVFWVRIWQTDTGATGIVAYR
jgi:hypothetical protein